VAVQLDAELNEQLFDTVYPCILISSMPVRTTAMKRLLCHLSVIFTVLLALPIAARPQQPPRSNDVATKDSEPVTPVFDPSSSLDSRITVPPDAVMKRVLRQSTPPPTFHELNDAERAKLLNVIQQLPPFAELALREHVRTISFFDGIAGNATTMKESGANSAVFNMVIRASMLNENMSEFLTRKERNCYIFDNSGIAVSVKAGTLSALVYILLHESVHVIDITNRHGESGPPRLIADGVSTQLVQGIWEDATTVVAVYRSPLLENSFFRTLRAVGIDNAEATYETLARTPFVSLYGSSNWYDDVADLVACYYLTYTLKQPYRILVTNGPETLYALSPMDSKLVEARVPGIRPLLN